MHTKKFWAFKKQTWNCSYTKKRRKRAINKESTKYISDRSFILKNRSIYKTKPNGDIVLDREKAGIVPWDVPRILVNEYKYA